MKPELGSEEAHALLARMVRALEADPSYRATLHHEPGTGLAHVRRPGTESVSDIAWNTNRTLCLVLDGELYDTEDIERASDEDRGQPPAKNQAEFALRAFERFGVSFVERLNGAFAIAMWDRCARTLTLMNDRLGLLPLYHAQVKGGFLFASGVRALLSDPEMDRTVDAVAVNQFLTYDHMLDDRTLIEAARLLPQGSVLTFRNGSVKIHRYWTPVYPPDLQLRSETEYLEQFIHHLRVAVRRQRAQGPAGLLLSGGLDSRLLAGVMSEQGADLRTLTFGIPGCDDARIASEVATQVRSRHEFIELKPDWLLHLSDEAVRLTDGLANVVNLHVLAPLADAVDGHSSGPAVVYKGFMGDALLGFALKRQMWGSYDLTTAPRVHRGVHREQGVLNYESSEQSHLYTAEFLARVRVEEGDAYREGMEREGSFRLATQRLFFDLTQRVPRMTLNGVQAARSRATVRLPFCDNDLVDFALTVPPGFLFERHLAKNALVKYFPALAKIPMANTGRPLISCLRDMGVQARDLISWHLARRGMGRLTLTKRRPYKDYDSWFRTLLKSWSDQLLLDARALDRGYFRPEFVRQLLGAHAAGENHAVKIGALLTLEIWHRQFID